MARPVSKENIKIIYVGLDVLVKAINAFNKKIRNHLSRVGTYDIYSGGAAGKVPFPLQTHQYKEGRTHGLPCAPPVSPDDTFTVILFLLLGTTLGTLCGTVE
jgi:hypothetical protein